MAESKKKPEIEPLTDAEAQALAKIVDDAALAFHGVFDELEKAAGMLMVGRLFGWKVLSIIHSRRTLLKYEKILGIKIKDAFPPEGPLAKKSVGWAIVDKLGDFWKAVAGQVSVANRREITK
jgi:hypothetical protein